MKFVMIQDEGELVFIIKRGENGEWIPEMIDIGDGVMEIAFWDAIDDAIDYALEHIEEDFEICGRILRGVPDESIPV
jgi:hypothetical protein